MRVSIWTRRRPIQPLRKLKRKRCCDARPLCWSRMADGSAVRGQYHHINLGGSCREFDEPTHVSHRNHAMTRLHARHFVVTLSSSADASCEMEDVLCKLECVLRVYRMTSLQIQNVQVMKHQCLPAVLHLQSETPNDWQHNENVCKHRVDDGKRQYGIPLGNAKRVRETTHHDGNAGRAARMMLDITPKL